MSLLMSQFADLEQQRMALEAQLSVVKADLDRIGQQLIEEWLANGVQNTTIHGRCYYKRIDRYVTKCGHISTALIVERLRDCGLGYLCQESYSPQSLKAAVCEIIDEHGGMDAIPIELKCVLNIGETVRIVSRSGA